MRRHFVRLTTGLALAGAVAACGGPTGPGSGTLAPSYFLSSVDGKPLPTTTNNLPPGWTLTGAALGFPATVFEGRPRGTTPVQDLVTYTEFVTDDQQMPQTWTSQLAFTLTGDQLTINLCPPLALCIARTELVGTVQGGALLLTHYLGDQPQNVYQYFPALQD